MILGVTLAALAAACSGQDSRVAGRESNRGRQEGGRGSRLSTGDARPLPTADSRPQLVFLGTSLTAGLGVDPDSAYPARIQRKLDSASIALHAVNAGVSGETSAGALRRLPDILSDSVRILVVETGANDGLRGLDVDSTRANLAAIIRQARARDRAVTIVLAQMEAPPNMGPRFTERFHAMYPALAREQHVVLMPFLLAGVAGIDTLNQEDGIHPTPRGHRIVADNVWRTLRPLVSHRSR